jgi:hypothetical protein
VIGILIQESTDMPGDEPTGGAHSSSFVGLLYIRTRVLPAWVGWASLVLALVMLIPPIGWAGLLLGFPLWTVLVSVLLWMRPAAEPSPPPTASQL